MSSLTQYVVQFSDGSYYYDEEIMKRVATVSEATKYEDEDLAVMVANYYKADAVLVEIELPQTFKGIAIEHYTDGNDYYNNVKELLIWGWGKLNERVVTIAANPVGSYIIQTVNKYETKHHYIAGVTLSKSLELAREGLVS